MFSFLIAILGILFTILFVVGTHEAAHFLVARLLGVKVLRFSIGFGKTLFRFRDKKKTEYVFALIPLGGYVKMLDEREEPVPTAELPFAYNRQPLYKKFLIVLAGPATNLVCAFLLYWLIFMIGVVAIKPIIGTITPASIAEEAGLKAKQKIIAVDDHQTDTWMGVLFRMLAHLGDQDQMQLKVQNTETKQFSSHTLNLSNWHMDELTPDPLRSLGIYPYEPEIPLLIGIIAADSPASTSPLKLGDTILAVDHQPIKNWLNLTNYINQHPTKKLLFTILRDNKKIELAVEVGYKRSWLGHKTGYLGIAPRFEWPKELLQTLQYPPLTAATRAFQEVCNLVYFNLLLFGKMLTGKLSLQSLGGPITIFESAGQALNSGFLAFIGFLAFLSISVGVINLLPIPGLDGGHLFLQIIEALVGKPIPDALLNVLFKIGFTLLFIILIQAFINDVLRL